MMRVRSVGFIDEGCSEPRTLLDEVSSERIALYQLFETLSRASLPCSHDNGGATGNAKTEPPFDICLGNDFLHHPPLTTQLR